MDWLGAALTSVLPPLAVVLLVFAIAYVYIYIKTDGNTEKIKMLETRLAGDEKDYVTKEFCSSKHDLMDFKIGAVLEKIDLLHQSFDAKTDMVVELIKKNGNGRSKE